ncbi:hypothetical protein BO83DRAFT_249058 [Aspergillus eucalypticola CBS 122712]|uniref:Integral membrane protein, Mpv17/PMP22 family n=1 Tax=Aspergillus eucalypticola (strain CBS 122712 / IBT 29274) TaxID=1448314 RepID=A0A317VQQ6_ASPEC|nr:uncharacterized protein BO83DRAFT_249058 [Aspergillus eucalypticola CBS 122712]PWY75889.1 hypothetical protein BO83DRAFT_249058 [Aspergillus eucalypticola CBS 122712]
MVSPLTTTFIQSTILNAIANILAQIIDHYRKSKSTTTTTTTTLTPNLPALLQFITYGIIIVPPNFIWQRYLERRYPGFLFRGGAASTPSSSTTTNNYSPPFRTSTPNGKKGGGGGGGPGIGEIYISIPDPTSTVLLKEKKKTSNNFLPRRSSSRGGWYNFLMKFLLDQTVGSVGNIVLFIVLINLLKGVGVGGVWGLVVEDFKPIMIARLKYRPIVSLLMYTVVPVDRRVVFGSACGVIWGVYLSLYAVV